MLLLLLAQRSGSQPVLTHYRPEIVMFAVPPVLLREPACAAGWLSETHPSDPLLAARCPLQPVHCFHFVFHNSLEILIKIPRLLLLEKKLLLLQKVERPNQLISVKSSEFL